MYFCLQMAATSPSIDSQDVQSFRQTLLDDYRLMCTSREASLLGRKEVLTGKAKFGIFGDGKEMAQVALAKVKQSDLPAGTPASGPAKSDAVKDVLRRRLARVIVEEQN